LTYQTSNAIIVAGTNATTEPMATPDEFVLRCIFLADFDLGRCLFELLQRDSQSGLNHDVDHMYFRDLITTAPDRWTQTRRLSVGEQEVTQLKHVARVMLRTFIRHNPDKETFWWPGQIPWLEDSFAKPSLMQMIDREIDGPGRDVPIILKRNLARNLVCHFPADTSVPRAYSLQAPAEEILLLCIFLADFELKCPLSEVVLRDSRETRDYGDPRALGSILAAICNRPIFLRGDGGAPPVAVRQHPGSNEQSSSDAAPRDGVLAQILLNQRPPEKASPIEAQPVTTMISLKNSSVADAAAIMLEHDGITMSDNKPLWHRFNETRCSHSLNARLRELLNTRGASHPLLLRRYLANLLGDGTLLSRR